jgi:hypothetical protein
MNRRETYFLIASTLMNLRESYSSTASTLMNLRESWVCLGIVEVSRTVADLIDIRKKVRMFCIEK